MRRVGAVCYGYQYSLGLFSYANRPHERMDVFGFVEKTHEAGGNVAQIYHSLLDGLNTEDLRRLRRLGDELDVLLEVHGGVAQRDDFKTTIEQAAVMDVKVMGCSFGMLLRPEIIPTAEAWDDHLKQCRVRYKQLLAKARPLGIQLGVENHLDFTTEELLEFVRAADAPNSGVIFDVGNGIGTMDDPVESAEVLAPYILATHYKDFAIEEVARGFRFTMVPLGAGSVHLKELTQVLNKKVAPEVGFAIEMMNGQQFEVKWLEERFWPPFRYKSARDVAATLRSIRSKAVDPAEFFPQKEVDMLPHETHLALEHERMMRCIATLKSLILETESSRETSDAPVLQTT